MVEASCTILSPTSTRTKGGLLPFAELHPFTSGDTAGTAAPGIRARLQARVHSVRLFKSDIAVHGAAVLYAIRVEISL